MTLSAPAGAGRHAAQSAHARRAPTVTAVGLGVLLVGVAAWVLAAVALRHERHAFGAGTPPRSVHVERGATYWIAQAGGVPAELKRGVTPSSLRCVLRTWADESVRLDVRAEPRDTKATEQIASFIAPITGSVRVTCAGLPDAGVDTATGDPSGYLTVLAVLALAIGIPLTLSGLRRRALAGQSDVR